VTLAAISLGLPSTSSGLRQRLRAGERPTIDAISVVVPVRDNASGIERILAWWRALDDRPGELLFVDDGSRVPVMVAAEGVRVLRTGRRGPAAARNTGWRQARGRWVAFLDSDCEPDSAASVGSRPQAYMITAVIVAPSVTAARRTVRADPTGRYGVPPS
jgi:hypothetical protein